MVIGKSSLANLRKRSRYVFALGNRCPGPAMMKDGKLDLLSLTHLNPMLFHSLLLH